MAADIVTEALSQRDQASDGCAADEYAYQVESEAELSGFNSIPSGVNNI